MKKNFIRVASVAAFVAIAGYGVYTNQKTDSMSELMLANVEALADDSEITPTYCPGGRHLCQWIIDSLGSTTYYDENGPADI